jgi:hypothetical protein
MNTTATVSGRAAPTRSSHALCASVALAIVTAMLPAVLVAKPLHPGPSADLGEIEACVSRNLPDAAGVIDFRVEAADRSGAVTASRAEVRWRKDGRALSQIVLRVSEPARTAGTALLIVDRDAGEPEFYLRLPEVEKVRRVRSKRLRGPVLGTDFSYEDLQRLRDPIDRNALELVGVSEALGRTTWLLETLPGSEGDSEYGRVLTHVDQSTCLPIRIDLFDHDDRLRKQLHAPIEEIRRVGDTRLPYVFVMEDLRRATRTTIRIEHFDSTPDLPAAQFTRHALTLPPAAAVTR